MESTKNKKIIDNILVSISLGYHRRWEIIIIDRDIEIVKFRKMVRLNSNRFIGRFNRNLQIYYLIITTISIPKIKEKFISFV